MLCFYQSWRKIHRPLYFCMGYHCKPGNNNIVFLHICITKWGPVTLSSSILIRCRSTPVSTILWKSVRFVTIKIYLVTIITITINFPSWNWGMKQFSDLQGFIRGEWTGQYRVWIPRTQNLTLRRSEYNQVWDYFRVTELDIRGRPTRVGINSVRRGLGKTCTMIYTMIIYIFTSNFTRNQLALFASFHIVIKELGPLLKRPTSTSPGLKFYSTFCIYLPMHCLE